MLKDFFNKDASVLKNKKLWLFDMDGTIYEENRLFDGTIELLERIVKSGGRYVFITNNSSKSIKDYVCKVNSLGIVADEDNFFTASQATVLYLRKNYPNAKVYCQGTKSLVQELKESEIHVTEKADADVTVILVGFDTELTSDKLRNTCYLLNRNLPFIATNCDLRCPVEFGYIPDCGSICQMITNATNKKPIFIGKPEPTMIELAMNKFGVSRDETVVVGDRLYTDIASGNNANVTSVCVLTGEATLDDIKCSLNKPTFTFDSIKSITI